MYSLTVKPFFLPNFSSSSSSSNCWPSFSTSIGFPVQTKGLRRRLALRINAYDSSKSQTPNGNGDSKPPNGTLVIALNNLCLISIWVSVFRLILLTFSL